MRNVWIIIKHEIKTTLNRRSFWITTFLLPLAIFVISFGSQALSQSAAAQDGSSLFGENAPTDLPVGYVDLAGLIKTMPDAAPAGAEWKNVRLRAYRDEATAQSALAAGKIGKYYLVPPDYMQTGKLIVVDSRFSMFNSLSNNEFFEYVLQLNLTGDAVLARALIDPTAKTEQQSLAPQVTAKPKDEFSSFGVPYAALFIFFFVITMTSGFMLQSVSKEKENRTIEMLLVSVRPRDVMLGKITGLGAVALLQVVIWVGGGLLITGSGQLGNIALPNGFLIWALLYFALGYMLYASVLGALGALAPSAREGTQFTFLVLLPLMVPLWLSNVLIESPNEAVSIIFSLFPLTSPTSMITRLAAGPVPIEQLLIGLGLLAVTTYGFVILAARFFRADTLLAMNSLNLKRIMQAFRS